MLTRARFGIDKDTLIPISCAEEKKVRSSKSVLLVKMTGYLSRHARCCAVNFLRVGSGN